MFGETGSWHGQTSWDERNFFFLKKSISREQERKANCYGRGIIKGINTLAVALVRYLGPFLKWTRKNLNRWNRELKRSPNDPCGFISYWWRNQTLWVRNTIQRLEDLHKKEPPPETRIEMETTWKKNGKWNTHCIDISSWKQAKNEKTKTRRRMENQKRVSEFLSNNQLKTTQ